MADIFDVVADPTRRDLLQVLLEAYMSTSSERGELSVGQIVDRLSLTQPTVSKHLKVLRDHGLVNVREEGQHRFYSLEASPLEDLEDWIIPFLSADYDPVERAGGIAAVSTAIAGWSGEEAGQRVGRVVAERSHRARVVIEDAGKQVTRGVKRITGR